MPLALFLRICGAFRSAPRQVFMQKSPLVAASGAAYRHRNARVIAPLALVLTLLFFLVVPTHNRQRRVLLLYWVAAAIVTTLARIVRWLAGLLLRVVSHLVFQAIAFLPVVGRELCRVIYIAPGALGAMIAKAATALRRALASGIRTAICTSASAAALVASLLRHCRIAMTWNLMNCWRAASRPATVLSALREAAARLPRPSLSTARCIQRVRLAPRAMWQRCGRGAWWAVTLVRTWTEAASRRVARSFAALQARIRTQHLGEGEAMPAPHYGDCSDLLVRGQRRFSSIDKAAILGKVRSSKTSLLYSSASLLRMASLPLESRCKRHGLRCEIWTYRSKATLYRSCARCARQAASWTCGEHASSSMAHSL